MTSKPSYKTVSEEISRLISQAKWSDDGRSTVLGYSMKRGIAARFQWDIIYRGGDDPAKSAGGLVESICCLMDVHDAGDLIVIQEEIGHRNSGDGPFWWNSTTWFYKSVERSIKLKREQQELVMACRRLPKDFGKAKQRRL